MVPSEYAAIGDAAAYHDIRELGVCKCKCAMKVHCSSAAAYQNIRVLGVCKCNTLEMAQLRIRTFGCRACARATRWEWQENQVQAEERDLEARMDDSLRS